MDVYFLEIQLSPFSLYLPYAMLSSYFTGHLQISNDAKLNMADGAY
jgi:hypothetical protein